MKRNKGTTQYPNEESSVLNELFASLFLISFHCRPFFALKHKWERVVLMKAKEAQCERNGPLFSFILNKPRFLLFHCVYLK